MVEIKSKGGLGTKEKSLTTSQTAVLELRERAHWPRRHLESF